MNSAVIATHENYLSSGWNWRSWLLTLDHKRIGILYVITITLLFGIGGSAAALIRLDLLTPHSQLVSVETYNKLFTMHGVIMVWFFLIPSIPATLGNFLVPMMIGARDLAFPRLNLLSWYLFVAGALFTIYALLCGRRRHGLDLLRALFDAPFSTSHVFAVATGVFIAGFSSILDRA